MVAAVLALAGAFLSAYLWLYKLGVIGTLACGDGGCDTVQFSPQSRFLGLEVTFIGLLGYAALLVVSMISLQPRYAGRSWPVVAQLVLSGGALAFTLYLKTMELFVIHAICRWCVVSAVIVLLLFITSVLEFRRTSSAASE